VAALPRSDLLLLGVRVMFWGAALVTFIGAMMSPAPHMFPRAEHFCAFYVLTVLAAVAYPAAPLVIIGLWLSLFGAVIELVQALPFIHRDCDILDWIAYTVAVLAVLVPMAITRWRRFSVSAHD
jgi:hypothetical protein